MFSRCRLPISVLLLAIALVPGVGRAQTIAQSFDQLQGTLKPRDVVIVLDSSDRKVTGKVVTLSPSSFTIIAKNGTTTAFAASDLKIIRKADPVWDGAAKGAAIGLVSTLLAFNKHSCHECGNQRRGRVFLRVAGLGAAIGLGIDAVVGPKTVYGPAQPRRGWIGRHPVLFGALVGAGVGAAWAGSSSNFTDGMFSNGGNALLGAGIGAGPGSLVGLIVGLAR